MGRNNNVISKTRRRLEDNEYWNPEAARCYLYSKKDAMIYWEGVKEHADAAYQRGGLVSSICFQTSDHCKHVEENKDIYWTAVVDAWNVSRVNLNRRTQDRRSGLHPIRDD